MIVFRFAKAHPWISVYLVWVALITLVKLSGLGDWDDWFVFGPFLVGVLGLFIWLLNQVSDWTTETIIEQAFRRYRRLGVFLHRHHSFTHLIIYYYWTMGAIAALQLLARRPITWFDLFSFGIALPLGLLAVGVFRSTIYRRFRRFRRRGTTVLS